MPHTFAHPLTRVRYSDADIQHAAAQYDTEFNKIIDKVVAETRLEITRQYQP